MKWFKHFSGASTSNKISKVLMRYGADGYAIYWFCLEKISSALGTDDNITFELKHDAEVIGYTLKIDTARVEEIMLYLISLELFEHSGGVITCLNLAKYIDKKNTRNKQIHKIIDSANAKAKQLKSSETVADNHGQSADSPRSSRLDTDTDTDNNKYKYTATRSNLPENFFPNQETIDFCKIHRLPDPTDPETLMDFQLHYKDQPKLSSDWDAVLIKWVKRKRVFDAEKKRKPKKGGKDIEFNDTDWDI